VCGSTGFGYVFHISSVIHDVFRAVGKILLKNLQLEKVVIWLASSRFVQPPQVLDRSEGAKDATLRTANPRPTMCMEFYSRQLSNSEKHALMILRSLKLFSMHKNRPRTTSNQGSALSFESRRARLQKQIGSCGPHQQDFKHQPNRCYIA